MAKFNLENYETVEDRLKKYWEENPQGRICTDVVHITEDGTCVTIKAEIYVWHEDVGLYCVSTGIAQETKGQGGFANADAWMENCETSAIGRALANWKYQGSNKPRPSREEMSKSAPKVEVEKKPVSKPTAAETKAMEEVVDSWLPKTKSKNVGEQLNTLLQAMIPDESLRKSIKSSAYTELVSNDLADKSVDNWSDETIDVFMTRAEDMFNAMGIDNEIAQSVDTDIVSEVFGTVTEKVERRCPECNSSDWIEDNREKKASDTRFAKIPSWSCSTYQNNNGCGWTAWGDTDCPTEWL